MEYLPTCRSQFRFRNCLRCSIRNPSGRTTIPMYSRSRATVPRQKNAEQFRWSAVIYDVDCSLHLEVFDLFDRCILLALTALARCLCPFEFQLMARRGHFGTRDISRRIVPPAASPTGNAARLCTVRRAPLGSIATAACPWAPGPGDFSSLPRHYFAISRCLSSKRNQRDAIFHGYFHWTTAMTTDIWIFHLQ